MEHKKIILIDGNSLAYRAFYALPTSLATSAGQVTNAVYGFTSMLIKLLQEEKPDGVAVAFDKGAPTIRHADYEKYKAHRPKMPDELRSQFPIIKEILHTLKIPTYEIEGYEADDILGVLAKKGEEKGCEAIVVTGDKDALQLISPRTKIMTTKKGISEIVVYDRAGVIERYGIPPEKIADLLGLKGDPSDNIPGIPGIGEKTATKLIQEYGSLEGVLANADKISSRRYREAVINYAEQARLSKKLATLEFDLPLNIDIEDSLQLGDWDEREVRQLFSSLEFNSLLKRLFSEENVPAAVATETLDFKIVTVSEENDWTKLFSGLKKAPEAAIEFITSDSVQARLPTPEAIGIGGQAKDSEGLAISFKDDTCYFIPLAEPRLPTPEAIGIGGQAPSLNRLKSYLESQDKAKIAYNGKSIILSLKKRGIDLRGFSFDVMIAAYLVDPSAEAYSLENLAQEYLAVKVESEEAIDQSCQRAITILKLRQPLQEQLEKRELVQLFQEIELPLTYVLAKMEFEGVGIDLKHLKNIEEEIDRGIEGLCRDIFNLAGREFNLNSPQQLGTVLFKDLALTPKRRTKTGYATGAPALAELAGQHPIIDKILQYRELSKLKSSYVFALPKLVNRKTGRLHTSFNQTVTATGRLSSSNPNLQNIPVRTELGREIRRAFVPARPSDELLVADYSQIELRILAHLSQDENLIRAFQEGEDIHRTTAAEVFGVNPEDVTQEMRRSAKATNFGIVYGISPYGLSQQVGLSPEEAKSYIDLYFGRYPRVKEFIDKSIADAYQNGYVKTLFNRRRYLPELKSSNLRVRQFGERLAINSPIQGSAADIIKLAMVRLGEEFERQGLQTKMVLQVHDELVFEVPPLEKDLVVNLVKNIMENVYPLRVKIKVDLKLGSNWSEAK